MVVQHAYDVRPFQIVWPGRQPGLFHISARLRPGISKDQFHLMLQDLLKKRFHFAFRLGAKEIPVYEMTVGKGGPKFKETSGIRIPKRARQVRSGECQFRK